MELFGVDVPLWLLLLLAVVITYYKYMTAHFGVFKNYPGVRGPKPWPVLGTMLPMIQRGTIAHDEELIEKYGKVVATFMGRQPALIVADGDILKEILIKQFSNFTNRAHIDLTPPIDGTMAVIKDDHWKHVRNLVVPTFSAAKLKKMTAPINRCCDVLTSNLKTTAGQPVDVKNYLEALTMDLIASTAFGLELDLQSNPDNPFVTMAKKAFVNDFANPFFVILIFAPFMSKILAKFGVSMLPGEAVKFFVQIIEKALAQREKGDSKRTDFLQLMINSNHDDDVTGANITGANKRSLTHNEILAQGFAFFVAGFDTVAHTCVYTLYSLATNPRAQARLHEEIMESIPENEAPTYESVQNMKYLDMVVSETLRLYPPAIHVDRACQNDVTIKGVFIPKGVTVVIPMHCLHHDADVYTDPSMFNPERFTEEAKADRDPIYYQPFGLGPRNCVAMRLALVEVKTAIVHIVHRFNVLTCPETDIPVKRNLTNGRPVGVKLMFVERH